MNTRPANRNRIAIHGEHCTRTRIASAYQQASVRA